MKKKSWNLSHIYMQKGQAYQPASPIGIIIMTEQFKIKAPRHPVKYGTE
jgi:hypothetical protein